MSSMMSIDIENSSRTMKASGSRSIGFPTASYIEKRMPSIREDDQFHDELPYQFKLGDPIQDEETYLGKVRNKVGRAVNSVPVQVFMTFLIVFNAIRKCVSHTGIR